MQVYYDLFQCWVQYRVGFIILLYYNYDFFSFFSFLSVFMQMFLCEMKISIIEKKGDQ